jgi:DNA-binding MarR family transcriptional regulator
MDTRKDLKEKISKTASNKTLLVEGSDQTFRKMVHDLLAFSSRLEEIRCRFGAYIGLSGIQYTILISVSHQENKNGVGVKSIADHLSLSGSFVTIETTKLVTLGLIEKRKDINDGRRVLLTVSDRGQALLDKLAPMQREINDTLFNSLNPASFSQLSTMATNLKEDADKALLLASYLEQTK